MMAGLCKTYPSACSMKFFNFYPMPYLRVDLEAIDRVGGSNRVGEKLAEHVDPAGFKASLTKTHVGLLPHGMTRATTTAIAEQIIGHFRYRLPQGKLRTWRSEISPPLRTKRALGRALKCFRSITGALPISAAYHPGFRASCATRRRASADLPAVSFAAPRTPWGRWADLRWLSGSCCLIGRRAATGS